MGLHLFEKTQHDAISPFLLPRVSHKTASFKEQFFFKQLEAKSQKLILNTYSKAFFPPPVWFKNGTVFPNVF